MPCFLLHFICIFTCYRAMSPTRPTRLTVKIRANVIVLCVDHVPVQCLPRPPRTGIMRMDPLSVLHASIAMIAHVCGLSAHAPIVVTTCHRLLDFLCRPCRRDQIPRARLAAGFPDSIVDRLLLCAPAGSAEDDFLALLDRDFDLRCALALCLSGA